jgi:uncharacterized protein YcbK (DUF882 family)
MKGNIIMTFFTADEFECKCKRPKCSGKTSKLNLKLLKWVESARVAIGVPITVTSGIRCKDHNLDIGGATFSQHMLGNALDLTCKKMDELYEFAKSSTVITGVGDGRSKGNFVHVDVKPIKIRRFWRY